MTGIIARDRAQQMVLLAGFGPAGVGTMWSPDAAYMADLPIWRKITRPGVVGYEPTDLTYDTAPEMHYPTEAEQEAAEERYRTALSYTRHPRG